MILALHRNSPTWTFQSRIRTYTLQPFSLTQRKERKVTPVILVISLKIFSGMDPTRITDCCNTNSTGYLLVIWRLTFFVRWTPRNWSCRDWFWNTSKFEECQNMHLRKNMANSLHMPLVPLHSNDVQAKGLARRASLCNISSMSYRDRCAEICL